ncbi:MAG: sulfite exporter TauE/SafE family protein [Alphaproteobacteria bacterium]|nr:MAG: sulfite exporter TauE/SafE family protein [Alphaproteobacteria bacterium]
MFFLTLCFFIVALFYATAGFGGGSTYNALLSLAETDYRIFPSIALLCNLIVVSGGVWRFSRAGHINLRRVMPWVVTSVPAAFLGGVWEVSECFFTGLLGISLLIAGAHMMYFEVRTQDVSERPVQNILRRFPVLLPCFAGLCLGLLAGIVGIGGGIFLAPLLYILRWDHAKAIAGTCAAFILCNSLAGLGGHAVKLYGTELLPQLAGYWPLGLAVLAGGQIGSWLGAVKMDKRLVALLTAVLILYVAIRLLWRWSGMVF